MYADLHDLLGVVVVGVLALERSLLEGRLHGDGGVGGQRVGGDLSYAIDIQN
jgi:hypothetical protein